MQLHCFNVLYLLFPESNYFSNTCTNTGCKAGHTRPTGQLLLRNIIFILQSTFHKKLGDADCSQEAEKRLVCFTCTENTSCSKCFAKCLELRKTKRKCRTASDGVHYKCCSLCPKNLFGLILKNKSENVTLVTLWLLTELVQ